MKYLLIILFSLGIMSVSQAQEIDNANSYTCYYLDTNNVHCYLEDSDSDLDMDNDGVLDRGFEGFDDYDYDYDTDVLDNGTDAGVFNNDEGLYENENEIGTDTEIFNNDDADFNDPNYDNQGVLDNQDDGLLDNRPSTEIGDDDDGL